MTTSRAVDILEELRDITVQLRAVVVFNAAREPLAAADLSPNRDVSGGSLERLREGAWELWQSARAVATEPVAQLHIATRAGSIFLVSEADGLVAATTGREPAVGLVLYDLRRALERVGSSENAK